MLSSMSKQMVAWLQSDLRTPRECQKTKAPSISATGATVSRDFINGLVHKLELLHHGEVKHRLIVQPIQKLKRFVTARGRLPRDDCLG
jgi:hypothetical protein